MRIFKWVLVKKDFIEEIEEDRDKARERSADYREKMKDITELLNKCDEEKTELLFKVKSLQGKIGGLTKQKNKLEFENKELEEKLKESMTDKYLVKKIRSSENITQKMKIKTRGLSSQTKKLLKEESENRHD